jgi:hypothetical protein
MGVSEGMSEEDKAMTREFDDRSVAAKASTERLTIIMTDFGKSVQECCVVNEKWTMGMGRKIYLIKGCNRQVARSAAG